MIEIDPHHHFLKYKFYNNISSNWQITSHDGRSMSGTWVAAWEAAVRSRREASRQCGDILDRRDLCAAYLRNPKKSQGNTIRNAVWRHLGKRLLCSLPEKSTKHFTEKHKKNAVWRCWKRDHCSYLLRGWRNASLRVPFVKPPCTGVVVPADPSATTSQSADGQMIIVNCTPVTFPIRMPEYFVNFFCDCFACRGAIIDYLKGWTFEEMKDQRRILWILRWKLHCTFIPDIILLSTFTAYYLAWLLPTTKLEP